MSTILSQQFPRLFSLISDSRLEADAVEAEALSHQKGDLIEVFDARLFNFNELMWLLCGALVPFWSRTEADELEEHISHMENALGTSAVRSGYRSKIIVDDRDSLIDVRYEMAVVARACQVLDAGSLQLEKPIPSDSSPQSQWKNSDVYGLYRGVPVRIEVTVVHEKLPPVVRAELDEMVRGANVPWGFRAVLGSELMEEKQAQRVRALIEILFEQLGTVSHGSSLEIDQEHFSRTGSVYTRTYGTSPLESVCFYSPDEFSGADQVHDVIHPVACRPVTPKHILEDSPNPKGVITFGDVPGAYTHVPVSTKVRQMLDRKRLQCETGHINIVALGNPLQMHDSDVRSAVYGAEVVTFQLHTDEFGRRRLGDNAFHSRDLKAPFVPAELLLPDNRRQFIDPFVKMSAVWHIRIGNHPHSELLINPNASLPLDSALCEALVPHPGVVVRPVVRPHVPASWQAEDRPPSSPDAIEEMPSSNSADLARCFVRCFRDESEALESLERLEASGRTLGELTAEVDAFWRSPAEDNPPRNHLSPTNDEMTMNFVVDAGGFDAAKRLLSLAVETERPPEE